MNCNTKRVMKSRSGVSSLLSLGLSALLTLMAGFAWAATPVLLPVGHAGNANDPATGFGAVNYAFQIGSNEVTRAEYADFLNAVAAVDPHALYNPNMGIVRSGSSGSYSYAATDGTRSVAWVSWYDALRFANWLNNGQPRGAQGAASTESGAYTFSGESSVNNRNTGAMVFLPSENEWYKAAYYQGGSAFYWAFPTRSDTPPLAVLPNSSDNAANYDRVANAVTPAGAYPASQGYYGTRDQAGNLWEWNEAEIDGDRGLRGGSYDDYALLLHASYRDSQSPALENEFVGFRIASLTGVTPPPPPPPPPANRAPVAAGESYSTAAGAALNVAAPGVLANDTDADGNALTAVRVSDPAHGTLTLNANGSFTYTPTAGYSGADSFAYKANDGQVSGNTATVAITVAPQSNRAPVAAGDSYSTAAGAALNVAAPGVLANDTDADGNALTAVRVSGPAHGTLTLKANGSFTYKPTSRYSGVDSFKYKANDGKVSGNTVTVTITVAAQQNRAPVAAGDSYSTAAGAALNVAAPGVLANDTDADGNALTSVRVSGPAHGTLALNANGSFTYTPTAGYSGADSFAYKANDGKVSGNTATVAITVRPVLFELAVGSGSGDGSYASGAVVNIRADAAPSGMVFDRWIGNTALIANVTASSTTLTMSSSAATVTATYKSSAGTVLDITSALWESGNQELRVKGKGPAGQTVVVTDQAGAKVGSCVVKNDRSWELHVTRSSRYLPSRVRATCSGMTDEMPVTRKY